jgi:hypothetical protein
MAFTLLYWGCGFKTRGKSNAAPKEKLMTTDVNVTKQVIHDKLESQIKTAEAKLDTLKARAETAKANLEIKAIAEVMPKKYAIQQKLQELMRSSGDRFEQIKADLESRIADFEKSMKAIESGAKAN